MSDDKIRFNLLDIKIEEEHVDTDAPGLHLQPDKRTNSLEITYKVEPNNDKVFITISLSVKVGDEKPFFILAVCTIFHVASLTKHVSRDNVVKQYELRNKGFLFFLVDNSLSHFRAVQVTKFRHLIDKIPVLPYIQANKIVSHTNAVPAT